MYANVYVYGLCEEKQLTFAADAPRKKRELALVRVFPIS